MPPWMKTIAVSLAPAAEYAMLTPSDATHVVCSTGTLAWEWAYTVAQRAHEISVRAALGASPRDVLGLVLGGGLALTAIGLAIGVATALAVTRLLGSLVFGISPRDPLTLGASAVLLTMVALLACYLPARRAAHLDPLSALRE